MCKKIYKINKKRIKVKQINKRLSISLSLLSGALIGGGIVGLIMGLRQCSKNSTALCLSTLINDKIRYQFIDEPTDADLYGEINRMNDYRFFVGELEFNRNTPFESITINSVDEKQYRGEVTIHYDVSPYISLSEWLIDDNFEYLSIVNLGEFYEPVSNNGDDCYTRLRALFDIQHSDDEWNSLIRNTGFTNLGGDFYKYGYFTGLPFNQQSTATPFIGVLVLQWTVIQYDR